MSETSATVPIAACEGVTVRYGRTVAADAVSFAVTRGSVYALLGRNGAGKSSLIRCLLGQRRPDAGRTTLFGEDAWSSRRRAMARVGVVPEEPDVPPEMTAGEAVAFCARVVPGFDAGAAAARLARFAVPPATPAGRLSKGQRGHLSLALALGAAPELLVLDDPTLGLDVVARKALYQELVGELADRGTTVLLTTHDLAGIETIADRVGVLVAGRLVLDEELDALKGRVRRLRFRQQAPAPDAAVAELLARLAPLAVTRGGWGTEAVVTRFEEGAFRRLQAYPGGGDPEAVGMSLEEIFVSLHEGALEVQR